MATVFMKWLETSPKDYERGIQLITLGRIKRIREKIAEDYAQPKLRVLDLGCGTGELTILMAAKGAKVSAVDASPQMLVEAGRQVNALHLGHQVEFFHIDAAMVDETFQPQTFDLIVCSLLFSEIPPETQQYLLQTLPSLLTPDGKILVIEESPPYKLLHRWAYRLVRLFVLLITWLLTRQIFTQPLEDFSTRFELAGFRTRKKISCLLDSLVLFEAVPQQGVVRAHNLIGKLSHHTSLKTVLKDFRALIFRMFPPYPKVKPGLYAVGAPTASAPVLVTGNFDLTLRRLVKAIDGRVDCWVLVVDSGGINVWCAAGGGFFTAEKVIGAMKTSGLASVVDHKNLVLPQLAANGVSSWKIREVTGWNVAWGPVRAEDIPRYFDLHQRKTEEMRTVRFPLHNRLEMLISALGFYALMVLLPVIIFWPHQTAHVTISVLGLGFVYSVLTPIIPGKDGLQKSIPFTILVLAAFILYTFFAPPFPPDYKFRWGIGLVALSVFTASELQGTSPLMRGEQANWIIEAIIALSLLLIYFGVSILLGWS